MSTLITGFEPFGELPVNPSQLIVEHFQAGQRPDLIALVLPTAYQAAGEQIEAAIRRYQPDAILLFGVAQRRKTISLERIAVNVDDASLADNAGVLASGEVIAEDGPIAYWSTLPIQPMLAALQAKNIPTSISNHAGTFVCNHTFYSARRAVERLNLAVPCGFIHVPDLLKTEGGITNGLPLEVMIEAVEICLDVVHQTLQTSESVSALTPR